MNIALDPVLKRRHFLFGGASLAALSLAGCATTDSQQASLEPNIDASYLEMYAAMPNEKFPIPAVDLRTVPPQFWRTEVADPTGERPGTLVVHTAERYLYLVEPGGRAIRYGVGIGREGFAWAGHGHIARKAEWPTWTPPAEMVIRDPASAPYKDGMPGGINNPLGARAMYIYNEKNQDTLYRVHGTNDPSTIGTAVSSGCVRLIDQDVIDLYGRVPVGTHIVVV
ncbi:MAG TPA: L,D-transpeptidase [Devosiaceae bacterium]|nr:L,D-transpeptidase [Devosiaceae bacterium]